MSADTGCVGRKVSPKKGGRPCVWCEKSVGPPPLYITVRTLIYGGEYGGEKLYADMREPNLGALSMDGFVCPYCDQINFYDVGGSAQEAVPEGALFQMTPNDTPR